MEIRSFVLRSIAIGGLSAMFLSGHAAADMTMQMCVNCHGADGLGMDSNTPIIAGIEDVVQEDALYAYKEGDRQCASMAIMCKMAVGLTDEQISALSASFAAMPYQPAGEDFDAALAETGKVIHDRDCAICHGGDEPGDPGSSILHGQRKAYLRAALQQYAAGERKQLPIMQKKTADLSSDDIDALVDYYASYRN